MAKLKTQLGGRIWVIKMGLCKVGQGSILERM
ncbi:hypothetical protein HMPREF2087_00651 [Helicobacter canis NCTC 12740]|uniref:Uncharacterized protein n=1 Tax=Helicobacter canis NCTC 12740 TaxID=1357399 RepID=V8CLU9_9HELI|nr:hypothetical protein HMPREF2087_00651 [Helicobacter canis NCTC 12740]